MNWSTQNKLTVREMAIFALLGAIMYLSKTWMEFLPNIHPVGMLTMAYTRAFRKKALIPLYIYVLLNGLFSGFSVWWIPYLYLWTILWAGTMCLPKTMSKRVASVVCPLVCGLHGIFFGTLYAPAQALFFRMNLKETVAWIIAGLPWDLLHGAGNLLLGLLIVPLSELLRKLDRRQM